MRLTWRDVTTTILLGVVGVITYLSFSETTIPLISETRGALLLVGAAGWAMCLTSDVTKTTRISGYVGLMALLGFATLAVLVGGLITASPSSVVLLATMIGIMWLSGTLHRHLSNPIQQPSGA